MGPAQLVEAPCHHRHPDTNFFYRIFMIMFYTSCIPEFIWSSGCNANVSFTGSIFQQSRLISTFERTDRVGGTCKYGRLRDRYLKRIKSQNDSKVFQKKVMEYLNQQSKSSSADAATKEPILTREELINKYQARTSAKRTSSYRDQRRSTEESLFGVRIESCVLH